MSGENEGNHGQPEVYEVGTIVNGHVWTGAEWVPVRNPSGPAGLTPAVPVRRSRGDWFRPKIVIGVWAALILLVLVLGFIPNATVQVVVSFTWFFVVLIALPATLIALVLWLVGVGAKTN